MRRLREPPDHHRHRAAAVADPDVELGMTVEHAAEYQRRDGDRLLRAEADDDVEVEALEIGIARRSVDPGGSGMDEQRHVELDQRLVERIERRAVQRLVELGADRRAPQPELAHRADELLARRGRVLHRQRREPAELVGIGSHELGHRVVVPPAERRGLGQLDVVEVGQRARRQHLEVDVRLAHRLQAQIGVGERAACVLDADRACNCRRDTTACHSRRCRIPGRDGRRRRWSPAAAHAHERR